MSTTGTIATAATPQQPQSRHHTRELVATISGAWMWMLLLLIVGVVLLTVARAWLRGSAGVPIGTQRKRRRPTDTTSAWAEAGRRMPTPDANGPREQDLHG